MMKHAPAMSPEDKQDKVFRVFENIAKGYDSANVRISLGMQDSWKKMLIRELTRQDFIPGGCPNGKAFGHTDGGKVKILDLCTGTGDIAIGAAKAGTNYQIIGMDFSPSMLRIAAAKARRRGLDNITWRKGNAMEIPCGDASFDAVSISFGLRNCADPEKVLLEIKRVLKPGGRILCLESFVPENALVRPFYRLYFGRVMPLIGGGSSHRKEYEWLQESTESFLRAGQLKELMTRCGFRDVKVRRRMMGACALHTGCKPLSAHES